MRGAMRIAILADIHGNLPAFEAALRHVDGHAVDLIVLAGDLVNGAPDSAACWQLAQSLHCPILRGNHERYVGHYGTAAADPLWRTEQFAPLQWTVEQFTTAERQCLAALPLTLRLPEAPNLLIVHAAARSDQDSLQVYMPDEQVAERFPKVTERLIVRGHDHIAQTRFWEERIIATTGSVGLPLDGNPAAQYLLLDQTHQGWRLQHQAVPYNLYHTIQRFADTDYITATGPMGRLFYREVATAAPHLIPFLRYYGQWSQQGNISLADAVERFLNHF